MPRATSWTAAGPSTGSVSSAHEPPRGVAHVGRSVLPGHERRGGAALVVALTLLALVIHLGWELAQCEMFFVHGSYDPSWRGMLTAALGDVLMTWLVYGVVAAVSLRWRWSAEPWRARQWVPLLTTALLLGAAVEWRGLSEGRWRYTDAMPVVPGLEIGLLPLVQMLALTPLLVALSESIARRWGNARHRPTR